MKRRYAVYLEEKNIQEILEPLALSVDCLIKLISKELSSNLPKVELYKFRQKLMKTKDKLVLEHAKKQKKGLESHPVTLLAEGLQNCIRIAVPFSNAYLGSGNLMAAELVQYFPALLRTREIFSSLHLIANIFDQSVKQFGRGFNRTVSLITLFVRRFATITIDPGPGFDVEHFRNSIAHHQYTVAGDRSESLFFWNIHKGNTNWAAKFTIASLASQLPMLFWRKNYFILFEMLIKAIRFINKIRVFIEIVGVKDLLVRSKRGKSGAK
jgi:hypothetical protein